MSLSPLAGQPAPAAICVNVPRLVTAYYAQRPEPSVPQQRVQFGTSGHRGSAFDKSFNESHKIYAESFRGANHLRRVLEEAQTIVDDALVRSPHTGQP